MSYAAHLSSDLQRLASTCHTKKNDDVCSSYEDLRKLPQSADLTRLMSSFADLMATLEPESQTLLSTTRSPKRPSKPSPSPEGKKRRVAASPPPLANDLCDNLKGIPCAPEHSRSLFHHTSDQTSAVVPHNSSAMLRQLEETNRALLQALHDERALRALSEDKAQRATDTLLEAQTQHEVDLGDHQLAVKRLKAQVRALCSEQPLADIYAVFEEHVTRLVNENEALRRRNKTGS